jgi:hypothetical protein
MEGAGRLNLRESLHLADSILRTPAMALALSGKDDFSLRLNLPPIYGNEANSLIPDTATLKVMATLYFQAELEQVGIIAVAELLADARYELKLFNRKSAGMLEEFFRNRRDWYDRTAREQTFSRLFGFSSNNPNFNANLANRDFQTRFANFCLSLWRLGEDLRYQKSPNPMLEAAVRQSALDLLVNLGARRFGDIFEAAKRIQNQLSKSIAILEDEGIGNVFQTKGMWNVLRIILNPNVPDFARLTTRGQSGLRLLDWLAIQLPQIVDKDSRKPILDGISPVLNWTEMWLNASGFDVRQMFVRRAF